MSVPHNIYIHVPFCASKCKYCAFYSSAVRPDWGKYADMVCSELIHWAGTLEHCDVPTIFFGGGTPSLMPADIFSKIMETIARHFHIAPDAEVTIEANPGTLGAQKLNDFIAIGMNRLSVGVQSLENKKLLFLGRRHSADDARKILECAADKNIRLSADFIYGLPGDTVDTVTQMCHDINNLGLGHCSMYELTIEPTTPLGKMQLDMPGNDEMAEMYCAISQTLKPARYEVSNYAAPGCECRHNQNVWDGMPYIGIGRAAAGRIFINGQWYEQMGAGAHFEKMTDAARAMEKIITGMRTTRGVCVTADVRAAINWGWVEQNPRLVHHSGNRLAATNLGLLTLDHILIELTR